MLSKEELVNLLTSDVDAFNQELNGKAIDNDTVGQIWTGKQINNEKSLADEENIWTMILG